MNISHNFGGKLMIDPFYLTILILIISILIYNVIEKICDTIIESKRLENLNDLYDNVKDSYDND